MNVNKRYNDAAILIVAFFSGIGTLGGSGFVTLTRTFEYRETLADARCGNANVPAGGTAANRQESAPTKTPIGHVTSDPPSISVRRATFRIADNDVYYAKPRANVLAGVCFGPTVRLCNKIQQYAKSKRH